MMQMLEELAYDMKKLGIAAGVFAAVIAFDTMVIIKWQANSAGDTRKKIVSVKKDIDTVASDIALRERNQGGLTRSINLQSENEIPQLLEHISGVAKNNGVKVLQITPLKAREAKAMGTQKYLQLTIKIDAVAGYHELGTFLNQLESAVHPVYADEFKITQGEDQLRQRMSLTLRTFVKK